MLKVTIKLMRELRYRAALNKWVKNWLLLLLRDASDFLNTLLEGIEQGYLAPRGCIKPILKGSLS